MFLEILNRFEIFFYKIVYLYVLNSVNFCEKLQHSSKLKKVLNLEILPWLLKNKLSVRYSSSKTLKVSLYETVKNITHGVQFEGFWNTL